MSEIEIYTKIMTAIEGADERETLFALDFVQRKIQNSSYARENAIYAKQAAMNQACQGTIGGGLGANYPTPAYSHEAAVKAVRDIVREEIQNAGEDTKSEDA